MEKPPNYQKDQENNEEIKDNLELETEEKNNEKEILNLENQTELETLTEDHEKLKQNELELKRQDIDTIYEKIDYTKKNVDVSENQEQYIDIISSELNSYQLDLHNFLLSKDNLYRLYKEQEQKFFVKNYPFPHKEKTKLSQIMSDILENDKNIDNAKDKIRELELQIKDELLKPTNYSKEIQVLSKEINSDNFDENKKTLEKDISVLEQSFIDSQINLTETFKSSEEKDNYIVNRLRQENVIKEKKDLLDKESLKSDIHNQLSYLNEDMFNYFENKNILNQDFSNMNDLKVLEEGFNEYSYGASDKYENLSDDNEKMIKNQEYNYYINSLTSYAKYKNLKMRQLNLSQESRASVNYVSQNLKDYVAIKEFDARKTEEELINQELISEVEKVKIELLEGEGKLTLSHEDFDKYFDKNSFEFGANLKQSNVGDCYLVSAMYSMSKSAQFEIMMRSSIKENPDGTWYVNLPLMNTNAETIKIYPYELEPEINLDFGKEFSWNKGFVDNRENLEPVQAKEGFQILEAAYIKKKFGEVHRLKVEAGWGTEAFRDIHNENISTERVSIEDKSEFNKRKVEYIFNNFNKNTDMIVLNAHPNKGVLNENKGYKTYEVGGNILYGRHAYSLDSVDKENKIIRVVNPWDTSKKLDIKFEEIEEAFSVIELGNLNMDTFLSNLQKM